jgi:hypothetical protein
LENEAIMIHVAPAALADGRRIAPGKSKRRRTGPGLFFSDTNKDGIVTREELQALAAKIAAEFGQGDDKGGPGKGGPGGKGGGPPKGGF